jgi:GTP cyclohydrolase II
MKVAEVAKKWSEGDWVVYRHGADESLCFLTLRLEKGSDASLQMLIEKGRHIQAFVNRDAWNKGGGPGSDLSDGGLLLAHDLSVEGFRQVNQAMEEWHLGDSEGWARLPVRGFPRGDILVHGGPEAYLFEASSFGEEPLRCLLLAQIDPEEAQALSDAVPGSTITIQDVEASRIENSKLISHTGVVDSDLRMGSMKVHSFYAALDRRYHWAFATSGLEKSTEPPLIRIESECLTGHVLGSKLCDCRQQMELGLEKVRASGHGALIYLRQEGRGIGLINKLKAYRKQQEEKLDTVDANLAIGLPEDARDYLIGAQILRYFGIRKIRLLTNNPAKVLGMEKYGLEVVERVPHIIEPTSTNEHYLKTKKKRMGHLI